MRYLLSITLCVLFQFNSIAQYPMGGGGGKKKWQYEYWPLLWKIY